MHLSVHGPVQRATAIWGLYTAINIAQSALWFPYIIFSTYYQSKTSHKKYCTPMLRPGNPPFGVLPSSTFSGKPPTKTPFPSLGGFYHSPFKVDGLGGPPPSCWPRTPTGVRLSCSHAPMGLLASSITCKTNNGGATPARTFVGRLRGCGFHPSNIDGWLIRSTLLADLGFV